MMGWGDREETDRQTLTEKQRETARGEKETKGNILYWGYFTFNQISKY